MLICKFPVIDFIHDELTLSQTSRAYLTPVAREVCNLDLVSWEAVELKGNHRAMFTEEPSA